MRTQTPSTESIVISSSRLISSLLRFLRWGRQWCDLVYPTSSTRPRKAGFILFTHLAIAFFDQSSGIQIQLNPSRLQLLRNNMAFHDRATRSWWKYDLDGNQDLDGIILVNILHEALNSRKIETRGSEMYFKQQIEPLVDTNKTEEIEK